MDWMSWDEYSERLADDFAHADYLREAFGGDSYLECDTERAALEAEHDRHYIELPALVAVEGFDPAELDAITASQVAERG